MRLYSRTGAASVQHEEHGSFDVDPDSGAVEVPDELGELLQRQHFAGQRAWENDAERSTRLADEDLARRRDPGALYDLLEAKFGNLEGRDPDALVEAFAAALAKSQTADKPPAKARPRKATA